MSREVSRMSGFWIPQVLLVFVVSSFCLVVCLSFLVSCFTPTSMCPFGPCFVVSLFLFTHDSWPFPISSLTFTAFQTTVCLPQPYQAEFHCICFLVAFCLAFLVFCVLLVFWLLFVCFCLFFFWLLVPLFLFSFFGFACLFLLVFSVCFSWTRLSAFARYIVLSVSHRPRRRLDSACISHHVSERWSQNTYV